MSSGLDYVTDDISDCNMVSSPKLELWRSKEPVSYRTRNSRIGFVSFGPAMGQKID